MVYEQLRRLLLCDVGVTRNEVGNLCKPIYYYHDSVHTLELCQLHYEVYRD